MNILRKKWACKTERKLLNIIAYYIFHMLQNGISFIIDSIYSEVMDALKVQQKPG